MELFIALLLLLNQQREINHLPLYKVNQCLTLAAQTKLNDMVSKQYFSHITPGGHKPWIFVDFAGYKYAYAGENLVLGFSSAEEMTTALMNSPGHRSNLLNKRYTEVGIATGRITYNNKEQILL